MREGLEECDDGNTSNTDACANSCLFTFCGDGIIQTVNGETCDDGNDDDDDVCDNDCAYTAACYDIALGSAVGPGVASGTVDGRGSSFATSCGSGGRGGDFALRWRAPTTGTYTFTTDGSTYDTVLEIRSVAGAFCSGTSLVCNDDHGTGTSTGGSLWSRAQLAVVAGTEYTIVIDAFTSTPTGTWILNISGP